MPVRLAIPKIIPAALVLATAAGVLAADAVKTDHDRIQGEWRCTGYTIAGHAHDAHGRGVQHLVFADDKCDLSLDVSKRTVHYTFTLDPSASPPQLDLTNTAPRSPMEAVTFGVYRFDGDDTLSICQTRPGAADRPTDVGKSANAPLPVLTYARVKP